VCAKLRELLRSTEQQRAACEGANPRRVRFRTEARDEMIPRAQDYIGRDLETPIRRKSRVPCQKYFRPGRAPDAKEDIAGCRCAVVSDEQLYDGRAASRDRVNDRRCPAGQRSAEEQRT
jgi:hypothetical protein